MATRPSVTQILAPYSDYSAVPAALLAEAAARGSLVHRLVAADLEGRWAPVPKGVAGYWKSYQLWKPRIREIMAVEKELTGMGIVGHPDLICRLEGDERLTIVDWKTPANIGEVWGLQLAGYWHLAQKQYGDCRLLSVRLRATGARALPEEYGALEIAAFLSALNIWRYLGR